MKVFILFFSLIFSIASFALTTLTVNHDVYLEPIEGNFELIGRDFHIQKGPHYCQISFRSKNNLDFLLLPIGTKFEITRIENDDCSKQNAAGICVISLEGQSQDYTTSVDLRCHRSSYGLIKPTLNELSAMSNGLVRIKSN